MSWHDLDHARVTADHSSLESERFGVSMARVVIGQRVAWDPAVRDQLTAALDRDEDVLVVRYPSSMVECSAVLAGAGRDVLPADSLVYWQASTATAATAAPDNGDEPTIGRGDSLDPDVVAAAVRSAFEGYANHYAANPLLDPALSLEGYVEWAVRMMSAGAEHGVVVTTGDRVDAWGMSVDDADSSSVEWVLAGVSPEARGRSLYLVVMAEVAQRAMARGIDRILSSTQAANIGIQRVWARAGWLPMGAVTTVHLVRRGLLAEAPTGRG